MHKHHSMLTLAAFLAISLFFGNAHGQDNGDTTDMSASTPDAAMEDTSSEHVARAVFTLDVRNREPTDTLTSLSNDHNKIYFFSELTGLGGQTVTHRWEYQGKTMGEVKFDVGGPRWLPQWTGEWRVSIIDGNGNEVGGGSFNYGEAAAPQN